MLLGVLGSEFDYDSGRLWLGTLSDPCRSGNALEHDANKLPPLIGRKSCDIQKIEHDTFQPERIML